MSRRPRPRLSSPSSSIAQKSTKPLAGPTKPNISGRSYSKSVPTAEAALAQVVGAQVPVGPRGRVADAEELVGVEVDHHLRAEDAVVADAHAVDDERRLFEVGGDRRPVEHRHAAEVDRRCRGSRPAAGDRPPGVAVGSNERDAGERVDHRLLDVGERQISRGEKS